MRLIINLFGDPVSTNPKIVELIDQATVKRFADSGPRQHLGLSEVGETCDRMLWLKFRWCIPEQITGQKERVFSTGRFGEHRMAEILRQAPGVELLTKNPESGHQYSVSYLGGHLGGSTDGFIRGLPGLDGWFVWEHKTANNISFNAMVKHGVAKAGELHRQGIEPEVSNYFAQANCYAFAFGQQGWVWTLEGKNKGEIDVQVGLVDRERAKNAIDRGARIVTESIAPPQTYKPTFYRLKFLSEQNQAIYNGVKPPLPNCRNCRHSSPNTDDGTWRCARFGDQVLDANRQRAGCADHTFIPSLIGAVVERYDNDAVLYRRAKDGYTFVNTPKSETGTNQFSSRELSELMPGALGDPNMDQIRQRFDAVAG